MKMPLQIESVLPTSKVESSGLQPKGVFSATLRGMLFTPDSMKADFGATGPRPTKVTVLGTNFGADWLDRPIGKPIGQSPLSSEGAQSGSCFPGTAHSQVTELREQIEWPVFPQLQSERAAATKGPIPGPAVESSRIERPESPSAIQQKMKQKTAEQNDLIRHDLIRQPKPVATPLRTASLPDVSPNKIHPQDSMHDRVHVAKTHVEADPPSGMAAPLVQLSDFVSPVATLQWNGPQRVTPEPSSNGVTSPLGRRSPSGRAAVQTMDTSQAAASYTPFADLGSPALARPASTLPAEDGESPRRPMSVTADHLADSQSGRLSKQKAGTTAIGVTPPLQTNAAHFVVESDQRTPLQMNGGIPKDTKDKTGIEQKSEAKVGIPAHPGLGPTAVEHPAVPNSLPATPYGIEKGIASHRSELNAAQMLQKMDMAASPGVMQLRTDARRLDVGVSSSTLGWVEVRATTGPSGRIDATLQTQNDASAHVLAKQSTEISSYAREHSVQLGQVSVGVGTGESRQDESRNYDGRDQNGPRTQGLVQSRANTEEANHVDDAVSLINVRV